MTDIVDQLRALYPTHPIIMEAADEIERLRELLANAERALEAFRIESEP